MDRRNLIKQSLAFGGLAGLSACAPQSARVASRWSRPSLMPYRMDVERIIDIKSCIRPFRPMGPRLDAEQIGDKLVIHNYGHGGSGWSLSWGSADVAVEKARSVLPRDVAVIGCGVIGLTSAVLAQRAGMAVTVYTRDLLPRTRSVRANGSWTPDSRIALTGPAGPAFGDLWERMARFSWKSYRGYLGLPGRPIDFCDQYILSDDPPGQRPGEPRKGKGDYASTGMPQSEAEFAEYSGRILDLAGPSRRLSDEENPFPVKSARQFSLMFFNFGGYGHLLMSEFLEAGGKIEIREFHSPAELAGLRENVIINCPGYAARDLWRDKTLIPVRGQTGWMVPQPEVTYGIEYRDIGVLPKSDGVMIQSFDPGHTGLGDLVGMGDATEIPDRAETEEAVRVIGGLFARIAI